MWILFSWKNKCVCGSGLFDMREMWEKACVCMCWHVFIYVFAEVCICVCVSDLFLDWSNRANCEPLLPTPLPHSRSILPSVVSLSLVSFFSRVCCSNLLLTTESEFRLMAQPCDLFVFAFQSHGGHTDHSFSLLRVQTTLSWFHFKWPKRPPHSLADAPKQTAKATACCCLKD